MSQWLASLWMVMEASRLMTGASGVQCSFPADTHLQAINVQVLPRGSASADLRDVYLTLNDKIRVRGIVRPTPERGHEAVLMQGISAERVTYTIGLHQSGVAVLEIRMPDDMRRLREGTCNGHHAHMEHWVAD